MTMIRLDPSEVSVACDPFTGRPRSVRLQGEQESVIAIERVREESAAYPVDQGPRTVFVVRTEASRLRLVFQHRARRWMVEGLDPRPEPLPSAA
jgi:hypothetical protein